ncbi:MAG: nucleotidyltransferase substrate binding protein [Myxococcota bacterium]|jgi:nucleotidyltransferase substrate binding protein (TIGR01987 family)
MSPGRYEERKREYARALARLLEAAAMPQNDIVRDAVIQRFEFTFELAWKTLKLFFEHQGLEVASPRQAFKKAFETGLIANPEEGDRWLAMLESRNETSHTYDEEIARKIHKLIVSEYAPLLKTLSERISLLVW